MKRFYAGLWIILAGFLAEVFQLVLEHLADFQLSETQKVIIAILLTALISQITKYLNNRRLITNQEN